MKAGVPPEAWWSPEDNEWILGPKDPEGRLHGEVRYWRPDGTLCCVSQLRHGQPHGPFERFHENGEVSQTGSFEAGKLHGQHTCFATTGQTTEKMHAGGLSREIVRSEYDYVHGNFVSIRYFGADGRSLGSDGKPLPPRPNGVPDRAIFNRKSGNWLVGTWNGKGGREGVLEVFDSTGQRLAIESYRNNLEHGSTTLYFPDGTKRSVTEYVNGRLSGISEQYYRSGQLARRAHFEGDAWAGTLSDWAANGDSIAEVVIGKPAPVRAPVPDGLAQLIAIGWGGDEERDGALARSARRDVRAREDPELVDALRKTGLDTAPRLLTGTRLARVLEAMQGVAAVDTDALVIALAERGGVGKSAALDRDDESAVAALQARVHDRRLTLSQQGLGRLPRAIRHFPRLHEIDASNNEIDVVPPETSEVFFLRKLDLNSNRLTTLPRELGRLRVLDALHLGDNCLVLLPEVVVELTSLVTLNLGNNQLERLPEDFGCLDQLRTLWLHDNPLAELPSSFAQLSSLSFLHLGNVPWSTPPSVIYEMNWLRELWIASPSLSHLPADIARLRKLERLIIWYSNLSELPDALFGMTSLRELRVRDNPLLDGTIDRLKEALPDCTIY